MKNIKLEQKKSKKSRVAVNSTASKKEYKQLKKEENASNNRLAKVIFVIAFITIAIVFVCLSGTFAISEIVVEGNLAISEEQIVSFSGIEKGRNLFAIDKKEIIQRIKENPYMDQVQVKRIFPNKIKLKVIERKIEYALPLANSFVFINRQGYILEISNNQPNVPILIGFTTDFSNVKQNNQLEQSDLEKIKSVLRIMEIAEHHGLKDLITKIDISNDENYAIYLESEGKIAYLGKGSELNTRFLYIKAILKEQQGKTGKIFVNVDLNKEDVYFSEEPI